MRPVISLFSRGLLLTAFVGSTTLALAHTHPSSSTISGEQKRISVAGFMTEVRLRKLHLVRPDLIPYPIETEVYC